MFDQNLQNFDAPKDLLIHLNIRIKTKVFRWNSEWEKRVGKCQ